MFSFSKNLLQLSYSNAEFKICPDGNTPAPHFEGEESLFLFPDNVLKLSIVAMQNSKCFPETIPRTHVLGENEVCFRSPKMQQYSPTAMQNSKIFPGTQSRTPVLEERGKFVFVLRKCTETLLYSNAEFKNSLSDNTPDPVLGEEKFVSFLQKVPKLSYSNAEFHNKFGGRTPVFGKGMWKLPPLEIISGYAPDGGPMWGITY